MTETVTPRHPSSRATPTSAVGCLPGTGEWTYAYAIDAGGGMATETIDWIGGSGVYRNNAIAISAGAVHVVWRDFERGGVMHAWRACAPTL